MSGAYSLFRLNFEYDPIYLVNGIAGNGNSTSLLEILQPGFNSSDDPNGIFATFFPLPGGSIALNEYGTYPFANQSVAANAVIVQPLTLSMMMICPATGENSWSQKRQIMTSLKETLLQHTISGGTYNIATPAIFWTNGLLLDLRDVSDATTNQRQIKWQWDFFFPLLTLAEALAAQNNLTRKVTAGQQVNGDPPSQSQFPGGQVGVPG